MNSSPKKSLKDILIFRGVKWSVVAYLLGLLFLVCVLYVKLSKDYRRISDAMLHQTSLVILADLQDGNYYGAKRSLDQVVMTDNFKGLAVLNAKGDIFTQSGSWDDSTLNTLAGLQVPTSDSTMTIFSEKGKVLVRGVWDQNGIMWGKIAAIINESAFLSVIIQVALWLIAVMAVVIAAYVIINAVVVRNAIRPLISFAGEINAIATQIDGIEPSGKGRDNAMNGVSALFASLDAYDAAGNEVDNLLHSFVKLINKTVQFFDASLKGALLAEKMSLQLAHDIRSPLSVLKGYVRRSREDVQLDVDVREYVGAAERSVAKLENMAEDLLDYARAHKINGVPSHITDMIRETLREVSSEAAHYRVMVEYASEYVVYARIDREKMGRVLTNMTLNAVQAHDKPGYVSIKVRASEGDLVITIEDDGKGIPTENLSHIFENSFTFGKPRGSGLGLAYCKHVVEAHGGTIEVKSEPGKGSLFTIRIPSCVESAAETHSEMHICTSRLEIGPAAGSHDIMVVDDDADILRQWRRIIDERGGRLVYAASSVEEVERADAVDFAAVDAAIVDYQYEGSPKNGIELIRFLKRKGVRQVHLCTGFHGDEAVRQQAFDAGADSVIPKPIVDSEIGPVFTPRIV